MFFISLQPLIIIFSLLGMILLYWIQKYTVLNRIKRPIPGTSFINDAMFQLISLGPFFYSLGALTWSHFLGNNLSLTESVPNLVAIGFAVTLFVFPFQTVFDSCCMKE